MRMGINSQMYEGTETLRFDFELNPTLVTIILVIYTLLYELLPTACRFENGFIQYGHIHFTSRR